MRLAYLILVVGLSLPTFVSSHSSDFLEQINHKIGIDCPSTFINYDKISYLTPDIPVKTLRGCIITGPDFWELNLLE